jgi:hypothetical protein
MRGIFTFPVCSFPFQVFERNLRIVLSMGDVIQVKTCFETGVGP